MDPAYGITRRLPDVDFDQAIDRTTVASTSEGFGVLTEIDVKATLKQKLGVDFRRYRILGACNPPLAHRALTTEPAIGLLLPCNVVVTEEESGGSTVSAAAPKEMFRVVDNPKLGPIVEEVEAKLRRALDSI
jgi:uncharacterized protein (DUF302 family)